MKRKDKPVFNTVTWDINHDTLKFYDVMPYFIRCWEEEKLRKHKIWNINHFSKSGGKNSDTKMPQTFEEFKRFITGASQYNFWARCEYEVILSGWPVQKNEYKLDVHEQVMSNIDVITTLFIDYVAGK